MTHVMSERLSRDDCFALLKRKSLGQFLFTYHALNAAAPVRYIVAQDHVLVHVLPTSDGVPWREGDVVTLYVNEFDADECHGWTVAVTGRAHGTPLLTASQDRPVAPWIAAGGGDVLAIPTELVKGERIGLTAEESPAREEV